MKDKQLLSVMFSDADQFREQLLHQTLGHVRRKRRIRQCGQALLTVAVAAAAFWLSVPRRAAVDSPTVGGLVQVVHTRPFALERIVTTRNDSVTIITSDKSSVALLEDDQLLDVVPGVTKLLVWHAPHEAELVIVGP
jgi:hypothetical protein